MPAIIAARPIVDERKTPEAADEQLAATQAIQAKMAQKAAAQKSGFLARFGAGQEVTAQPGRMLVVAELNYDDSDVMTDYFNRHHGIGPEFCLAIVPAGPETEAKARAAVARFPELASVPFGWHTEKYSMGHGNYLDATGGWVDLDETLTGSANFYDGGGAVNTARWEISFRRAYSSPVTLPAFKGWPGVCAPETAAESVAVGGAAGTTTVKHNASKDGIEIKFGSKPAASVLDDLKAHGWRWSRFSACWYQTASDSAARYAARLAGLTDEELAALLRKVTGTAPDRFDMQNEDNMAAACGL
jgi:hypothetical protein